MSTNPFPEELRGEYDAQLLNAQERGKKARQLREALGRAGLWKAPHEILDVGCGTGLILAKLDAEVTRRVGCDLRANLFLPEARAAGVEFVRTNMSRLPFPADSFDMVLCMAVIEEPEDWRGALEEMARVVSPGGVLYVTFTNGKSMMTVYKLKEWLGRAVGEASWRYARASLRFTTAKPQSGYGLKALKSWRFVDVTPHLMAAAYPATRYAPSWARETVGRVAAPSFAFAWQRPN